MKKINFLNIVFVLVPFNYNLFDPFPANFQSSLHIVFVRTTTSSLSFSTEAFYHGHKLRNKVCDSVGVLDYIFFDHIQFFEFRWRILLIGNCFWPFISFLFSLAEAGLEIGNIFIVLWSSSLILLNWTVSFALSFFILGDLIL